MNDSQSRQPRFEWANHMVRMKDERRPKRAETKMEVVEDEEDRIWYGMIGEDTVDIGKAGEGEHGKRLAIAAVQPSDDWPGSHVQQQAKREYGYGRGVTYSVDTTVVAGKPPRRLSCSGWCCGQRSESLGRGTTTARCWSSRPRGYDWERKNKCLNESESKKPNT